MDAFEQIRRSAFCLHEDLVAEGADPLKPASLVEAAVRHLDLEVVWLEPGNASLKGARAVFDEQSGTICCETTNDPAARALLIAHELGHARLHAKSAACIADNIDPARSMEAAPVGLQRVEDYGPRERRELQANVFARELLFPRGFAWQLHVDESLGVSSIAERTGLPLPLVCQQIFDAVLLPWPPQNEPVHGIEAMRDADPSQERAAAHRGTPFQLQAGPGTGKTRTLVSRVLSLLGEGVDPAAILVLTFSNRAAGELSERISDAAREAASRIWIGTSHAFGLDLIRRYHDRLGLSAEPVLFDRSDAIEVLEEILPTLPLVHYRSLWDPAMVLREIVSAISRAKDEVATPERYRNLAQEMLDNAKSEAEREPAEKSLEVAQVYALYEAALRERDAVDFGDLIMRSTLLLESDSRVRISAQFRHRHVLVDEFQDVNHASARLLKVLAGDGKRLWVVGDTRQSIYRFRGASSSNMSAFTSEYREASVDRLSVNYRSTAQIVRVVCAVALRMNASRDMLPLEMAAARREGNGVPEIRRFHMPEDEISGIAASIEELRSAGVSLRDQAVLCRSNARLNEIAVGLEARGIPVLHLGSLFERDEVRDLLALLTFVSDRFGHGLTRVGAMPRYDLSLQDIRVISEALSEDSRPNLQVLPELAAIAGLSPQGAVGLARLAEDLEGFSRSSFPWPLLCAYLLDRTDLAREFGHQPSVSARMRGVAIWQLLNFIRDQVPVGSQSPIQRVLDRVRQLVLLAEERDLRQVPAGALHMDAVRLMTVHGSKGLEFEAVHIPGLTVSSFPSNYRGLRCPPPAGLTTTTEVLSVSDEAKQDHEDEEQCLFFVALSRAKTHLRLYLADAQPNGNKRKPSPYLEWIPSHLSAAALAPMRPLSSGASNKDSIPLTREVDAAVSDTELSLYEKCPRRYFYSRALGLAGGRKATAFSRTHDCVYELMRWMRVARAERDITKEDVESEFETIWQKNGPIDHAFAAEYRNIASRLTAALVRSGTDRRFRPSEPIVFRLAGNRIVVEPNEEAELPSGAPVLRRVRTGHKRVDEYDRLDYTLYQLAGEARFGKTFGLEAHHLADDTLEPVSITPKKLQNRREKIAEMLAAIEEGKFPPKVDPVTCPRCPHFFICPAVPPGRLTLN